LRVASIGGKAGPSRLGQALRHRRWQALALVLLATTVTSLTAATPLYSRAMGQALTTQELRHSPLATTSLQVSSQPGTDQYGRPTPVVDPEGLSADVPAAVRRHFLPPLLSRSAHADGSPFDLSGQVVSLPGACQHLRMVAGRCPTRPGEMAVSEADLHLPGLRLGRTTVVRGVTRVDGPPPQVRLSVVGVYRIRPGAFWQGRVPTGKSGKPGSSGTEHDDWIVSAATITSPDRPLPGVASQAVFPVDTAAVDLDALEQLPDALEAARTHLAGSTENIQLDTGIDDIARDVAGQRHQASRTVPLLMLQVVLLALVVLWQLLGAATDQRRSEIALARLRGRGVGGARRLVLAELLPVTLLGAPLGALGAIALSWCGRRAFLPTSPFELPAGFWLAVVLSAVVLAALTIAAVAIRAREPMVALIRGVPARSGWRWGVLDAMLLTLAATGVVAFAAGGLTGAFALAGPALVALFAGLVLSHVAGPAAGALGRVAIRRGRLLPGLAALEAARRPGTRRTIAMLTIATTLLVFAADAHAVAAHNRQVVAQQVVGAARVLTVTTDAMAPVRAALADVDPSGTEATPVVRMDPLGGAEAPSTMAVVPDEFRRIAYLGADARRLDWQRLDPQTPAPLRITGDRVALTVRTTAPRHRTAGLAPLQLTLHLLHADGSPFTDADLGAVPTSPATSKRLGGPVPCADGCVVAGIGLGADVGADQKGRFTLGPLQVGGGRPVPLGPGSHWLAVRGVSGTFVARSGPAGGLAVRYDTAGASNLTLPHAWVPVSVPGFLTGRLPPGTDPRAFDVLGLDRADRPAARIDHVARIPAARANTVVVDLDALSRGAALDPSAQVQVWLSRDDPALVHRVTAALARHGAQLQGTASVSAQRSAYDESIPTWSLALGVITGAIALLIALIALVIVAVTSWRPQAYDLAALRMAGLTVPRVRRAVITGQLAAVVVAVAVGTAGGLVGVRLAIHRVPLFAHRPPLAVLELAPAWGTAGVVAGVALVVLGLAACWSAVVIAGRARLERLREVA
jgi:hypothetical protein